MKKKDVWKECTIDFNFESHCKMMVSNPGNLKSFTKLNTDVRLVKGLLQEYYRCLRTKLRKQKKTLEITQINKFQNEIISLNAYIEKSIAQQIKTGEKWNQVRLLEDIFKENKKEKWQAT